MNSANSISFGSIASILRWTGKNDVRYMEGSEKLPYVYHKNLYHYFSFDGKQYQLVMTSEHDLQERKA